MAFQFDYRRYLASKRTVDDRALNRHVWQTLTDALNDYAEKPLLALEIGGGVGTMIERALEWELFPGDVHYTLLDDDVKNINEALHRLPHWADENNAVYDLLNETVTLTYFGQHLTVQTVVEDVFDFAHKATDPFDLVIAHHFLDLVHVPTILPELTSLVKPGGLMYFTLNFDGLTAFEPELDPELDDLIISLYHQDMDRRMTRDGQPSGDSRTGRHLLGHLRRARASLLAAGSSDWVVVPAYRGYPADEAYFLHAIIDTIRQSLDDHKGLDQPAFQRWIDVRHRQIDIGDLILIIHQLDVLARRPT